MARPPLPALPRNGCHGRARRLGARSTQETVRKRLAPAPAPPPPPPRPRATTRRAAAMAYRRKQGIQRSATFVEDHRQASSGGTASPAIASPRATRFADDSRRPDRPASRLAAQAMVATSAARGDLTLPAFGDRFPAAAAASLSDSQPSSPVQDPVTQLYTSTTKVNDEGPKYDIELSKKDETRHGFWSLVAQKAKVMLDENGTPRTHPSESRWSYDRVRSSESPTSRIGSSEGRLDIGGKIKNVLEQEGLAVADNTTPSGGGSAVAARKLQIRRKACSMDFRSANLVSPDMSPMLSDDVESPQIKASRDVANAMAAKVKLLQRELKTLKADLAFSKERCAQLEEENRLLRDGNHDADEDMIRQQLETLLGEKARLAHENTVYARENRFLREIVEYHQLNMQDVVNLDDDDIEDEDEDDIEEAGQYQDRSMSLTSHLVQEEEEEEHQAAGGPDTAPQSPSRHTESPRMPSTGSGVTMDNESPRMLNTNSGGTVNHESSRMLSTNSGGNTHNESPAVPRSFKDDDGSSPETTIEG
ncbi:hypothetical protein BAE44_0006205 [Dichanthelium oligosanthes]|uniref:Uncharacterized protein n=1 Tax=Dichanthelium oligosanthes TaxID=888268 RepID=A0A1E5W5T4_9POAL|nr:hypothetical protein BAE44_0006205 [Dichanthelium oligosanthes]